MFHKVYHIFCRIKSLEKVRSTKKLTLTLPQDAPTIQSTLANLMKVPSSLHDSNHLRFGIATRLALIPMGSGNALFAPISGAMSQRSGVPKIGWAYPSSAHFSYFHRHMASGSCLLWPQGLPYILQHQESGEGQEHQRTHLNSTSRCANHPVHTCQSDESSF